ncbi:MAG: sugar transferase, partial [Methylococcus sp.]
MSAINADAPHEEGPMAVDWEAVTPRSWYARRGHALLDVVLLIAVSIPALFLMTVIALCNLITFGDCRKIFFKQPRLGLRGQLFKLYKFRTMRDAPEGNFCAWREGDKARVTTFGRLLRSTHLDELPQIINILQGEMSFIGPRPEMLEIERWA